MKLLFCEDCRDAVSMTHDNITRSCKCGKVAGKYLKDKLTAVVTEHAVVFGIDNNSFSNAVATVDKVLNGVEGFDADKRYDFFFTGWIPTIPGEVIIVPTKAHVMATDYYQEKSWTSENPSTAINELS
jgi:hypothetical protein